MPETTGSTPSPRPLARPERTRFALSDDATGVPLELPRRSAGMAALIVAVMFVVFAAALVPALARL
jgi:hypothetical protein